MDETPAAVGTAGPAAPPRAGLRANAIDLKDAVIVGMASSGPTASIALTLAAIVGVSNYGGPIAILICGLPMFGIALAYRRLNRWQVDCGASYTWIGRAITPYLGFIVGWIMLLGYFLGTISDVLPIGPYVLTVFAPSYQNSQLAAALSGAIWLVIVTIIAYIGIKVTARFQWVLATYEGVRDLPAVGGGEVGAWAGRLVEPGAEARLHHDWHRRAADDLGASA
jgi:amino acid transporter